MSNLCSTGIVFYSKNKKTLKDFQSKLIKIYDDSSGSEYEKGWMGNFANAFYPEIGADRIECGGNVEIKADLEKVKSYYCFRLYAYTNWSAKMGLWAKIVQDFYSEIKVAYISEECGCEYFAIWDDEGLFFPYQYYFDICYPDKDGEEEYADEHGFNSINEIICWLDNHLPFEYEKKESDVELEKEIYSKLEQCEDADAYFCTIAKYREINPNEFNFYKT